MGTDKLAELEEELSRLRAEVVRLGEELAAVDAVLGVAGGVERMQVIRGLQSGQVAGGTQFEFRVGR